ncbi:mandelate racemase/muconate lactonizing enzyme family protein [Spiribacter halobius]|uniref:Mandelate racemase n=1 Tax=Sediminicurvatus halobius TaxID=2182432 RepID=A0A2U2N668_9GAMM|nr:enolase C-terminal domain-like protein [Spiribacter halobius]PWG64568.1 mandelate racemase [Spiribacter halobius]UEX79112.1 hypothetical protein LMH63_05560 [Spiribacter halobius]
MRIEQVTVRHVALPLSQPYRLAIGVVERFDTLLVEMRDDTGRVGYGEATVLPGYTEETLAGAWQRITDGAERLVGLGAEPARAMLAPLRRTAPFSATALATAVEMLAGHPALDAAAGGRMPLLALLHADAGEALAAEVEGHLAEGYDTLKVKVGFDVGTDLARVARIRAAVAGRARLRLDANQGYDREQACRFVGELDPDGIELVEQTCAAGDWEAAVAVARVAPVPLMLDESIYGHADIERAAELGCAGLIKFKLMKAGGLDALEGALQRIRELGMTPVLGNGVAGEIGCWLEACVGVRWIDNAGEMNGFLKPRFSLLREPLQVEGGALRLPAGPPVPDPDALAAATVASHTV